MDETIAQIVAALRGGRRVGIRTRQGQGLGDPMNTEQAVAQHGRPSLVNENPDVPIALGVAPAIEEEFDDERMLPFYSSNVEGGYFIPYSPRARALGIGGRGDLYLKFQKRRPETPEGLPIGGPRAYVYQNVDAVIWESLLAANSPGGLVWDVIRRGGIEGDRIS